jgi:exopolyphosphatase/pppGpp-phosphohydrolase
MCYTCGCGKFNENMGDARNITLKDFEDAAKAAHESVEQAKKNALESLKKDLGVK